MSRDSNYIPDVVIGPKFGNYSISMGEVMIISMLEELDQNNFLRGVFGSSSMIWNWHLVWP